MFSYSNSYSSPNHQADIHSYCCADIFTYLHANSVSNSQANIFSYSNSYTSPNHHADMHSYRCANIFTYLHTNFVSYLHSHLQSFFYADDNTNSIPISVTYSVPICGSKFRSVIFTFLCSYLCSYDYSNFCAYFQAHLHTE